MSEPSLPREVRRRLDRGRPRCGCPVGRHTGTSAGPDQRQSPQAAALGRRRAEPSRRHPSRMALPRPPAARVATTRLPPLQVRSVSAPAVDGSVSGSRPPGPDRVVWRGNGEPVATGFHDRGPTASPQELPVRQPRTSHRPGCCSTSRPASQNRSEKSPAMPTVGPQGCSCADGTRCRPIVNPSSAPTHPHLRAGGAVSDGEVDADLRGPRRSTGVRGRTDCLG